MSLPSLQTDPADAGNPQELTAFGRSFCLSWSATVQTAHSRQPYCVIVGGGQGGIALGARLRQLDVPTIIVEKNERPGDSCVRKLR